MRYLLISLLSILPFGCSSVPKEHVVNNNTCQYYDPVFQITEEELTLDPSITRQLENKGGDLVTIDNKYFKNEFWYSKNESLRNLQTNKLKNILKIIGYDHKGKIKWAEFIYINGYKKIYKEFDYNEQGNITKIINYEKGYKICWAEAIEIVKKIAKKDIEKYNITEFNLPFRVNLNKFPNEKPEWGVTLAKNENYNPKEQKVYWIDGVTGKFLRTSKISMTYEE